MKYILPNKRVPSGALEFDVKAETISLVDRNFCNVYLPACEHGPRYETDRLTMVILPFVL